MKKMILLLALTLSTLCSCGNINHDLQEETVTTDQNEDANEVITDSDTLEVSDNSMDINNLDPTEENEMNIHNKQLIATALGIENDDEDLDYILKAIYSSINVGKIQSAELGTVDSERVINIVAEDNTNYQVYITVFNSVMDIKNLDTNEWPRRAIR